MWTLQHDWPVYRSPLPSKKNWRDFFIVLFSEGRGPSVHCTQTTPNDEYLYRCLHGGRKIVPPRRSWKADHPGTICFLYSVYMQKDLLIPSARIFLVLAVADLGEGPGGLGLPPFFRPNWGPKSRWNVFGDFPPSSLSQGVDDQAPHPHPLISTSGSGTD